MSEELTQRLLQILQALKILSPRSFSLGGTIFSVEDVEENEEEPLVECLARKLYVHCYSREFDGVAIATAYVPQVDEQFGEKLSHANTGCERLDRAWIVSLVLPTGHYLVQKNGLVRAVSVEEFVCDDAAIAPGVRVSLCWPKESRTMHPAFYYIFGSAITDQQDDDDLLRWYWNIKTVGVLKLVHLLTQRLNKFQIPFRLKCLNDPAGYDRADAAVLYINKRFYRLATELLAEVYQTVADQLAPITPLFSKQLAPGLGLAEEPETGESFGQQRCRILAKGIWNAHVLNRQTEHERLAEVVRQFELSGLSFDRPYLNSGSTDDYDFPSRSR